MNLEILKADINKSLKNFQQKNLMYETVYENKEVCKGINEFLFFIKPEITSFAEIVSLNEILNLIFSKIDLFGFSIQNIKILSAKYLSEHNIIAQHYGVINKLATDPLLYLSEEAKTKFYSLFNLKIIEANVIGGIDFLKKYPVFSPEALDHLCQNTRIEKLAGGTYVHKIKIDGKEIFLINGFHPRQLEHFTAPGRSIVTFTLVSDTPWKVARNDFIGKTNPADAAKGSIRNELLVKKEEFGLKAVSSSWNGVHLSAGPVEGLVELIRYNSDFSRNILKTVNDYKFGQKLTENFPDNIIEKILSNTNVYTEQRTISVFDLTEEFDSTDAIESLKRVDFRY